MRRSKRELVEESSGKVPALKMMHSCDDGDREREKERRRGERIENRETQNCFVEGTVLCSSSDLTYNTFILLIFLLGLEKGLRICSKKMPMRHKVIEI